MSKQDSYIGKPFPNPEIPDLDEKNLMRPPWEKYPNLQIGSLGWRMGAGETYLEKFEAWFSRQARPIRLETRTKYPAPIGWEFFWPRHFGQD
jgi:hypothetical protein